MTSSSGTQALQACKARTPPSLLPTTVVRQHLSAQYYSFQSPRSTIASYRRYTTLDKSRPQNPPQQHPVSEKKNNADPEPKQQRQSLLDQMGATRNVKIAVIIFLCIYGTMETVFYAGALYRYLSKEKPAGESGAD